MNTLKCSIFCSFYKGQKFIDGYLENILEQTIFDSIEFVFLDCASPEKEKNTIEPLTKKYANIKYYRLDNDPGLYAAWNIAVKKCSSSIIGNWNIDDRKNKEGLEILLNEFNKNTNLDLIYGFTYISRIANEKYINNSFKEIYPYLPHTFDNLLLNNNPHCMPLWKKSLHERFGWFDENYKTASDADFWLRCCVGGATIGMVNHPVGLYYENPTGRSTNPETLQEMINEVNSMRSKYRK
ncbi:MAG: glycosyltransferase [Caulobacteraceae bacterium]|nr:glycosyltransferase [Caulobacteraceae bacterium]